jgi:hypothetical protein
MKCRVAFLGRSELPWHEAHALSFIALTCVTSRTPPRVCLRPYRRALGISIFPTYLTKRLLASSFQWKPEISNVVLAQYHFGRRQEMRDEKAGRAICLRIGKQNLDVDHQRLWWSLVEMAQARGPVFASDLQVENKLSTKASTPCISHLTTPFSIKYCGATSRVMSPFLPLVKIKVSI